MPWRGVRVVQEEENEGTTEEDFDDIEVVATPDRPSSRLSEPPSSSKGEPGLQAEVRPPCSACHS